MASFYVLMFSFLREDARLQGHSKISKLVSFGSFRSFLPPVAPCKIRLSRCVCSVSEWEWLKHSWERWIFVASRIGKVLREPCGSERARQTHVHWSDWSLRRDCRHAETEPARARKSAVECTERNCRVGGPWTGSLTRLSMPSLSQDAVVFVATLCFHCTADEEWSRRAPSSWTLRFWFSACVFFASPLLLLSIWVCFVFFVRRRLHLKWLCILKVPAMGDDNLWNGKWVELLEEKKRFMRRLLLLTWVLTEGIDKDQSSC